MAEPELESGVVSVHVGLTPARQLPTEDRLPIWGVREWKALTQDRAGEGRLPFSLKQSICFL